MWQWHCRNRRGNFFFPLLFFFVSTAKHTDSFSIPLAMSMWFSHQSMRGNNCNSQIEKVLTNHDHKALDPFQTLYVISNFSLRGMRKRRPMRRDTTTTKKRGYPSIFKSAGIAPKSAGIGSKFLSRRFFSRRFRPPLFKCGDRVVRTCTGAFQKRWDRSQRFQTLFRRFWKRWDSLYENVNITYSSASKSAGICSTYSSAFKSAGIGLESV